MNLTARCENAELMMAVQLNELQKTLSFSRSNYAEERCKIWNGVHWPTTESTHIIYDTRVSQTQTQTLRALTASINRARAASKCYEHQISIQINIVKKKRSEKWKKRSDRRHKSIENKLNLGWTRDGCHGLPWVRACACCKFHLKSFRNHFLGNRKQRRRRKKKQNKI